MDEKEVARFVKYIKRAVDSMSFSPSTIGYNIARDLSIEENMVFGTMAVAWAVHYFDMHAFDNPPKYTTQKDLLDLAEQIAYYTLLGTAMVSSFKLMEK